MRFCLPACLRSHCRNPDGNRLQDPVLTAWDSSYCILSALIWAAELARQRHANTRSLQKYAHIVRCRVTWAHNCFSTLKSTMTVVPG